MCTCPVCEDIKVVFDPKNTYWKVMFDPKNTYLKVVFDPKNTYWKVMFDPKNTYLKVVFDPKNTFLGNGVIEICLFWLPCMYLYVLGYAVL